MVNISDKLVGIIQGFYRYFAEWKLKNMFEFKSF